MWHSAGPRTPQLYRHLEHIRNKSGLPNNHPHNTPSLPIPTSSSTMAEATTGETTPPARDTILVTGANGFVGQHVVKALQEGAPHVQEIRVLDLLPFAPKLEYESTKVVRSYTGSVTDSDMMRHVTKDVTSVIHIAGLVSYGSFPDFQGMEAVNVDGTLTVVRACLGNSVQRLLYCSTVDVVVGFEPIRGGAEDTPIPSRFLFPGYPETKLQGERLVLAANGQLCDNGNKLHTLSLRANVMYGELDPYYITSALHSAKSSWGRLLRVGNGQALFQQSYVGNAAAAFLQADAALQADPAAMGGEVFFIPDETPVQNTFHFMEPYLHHRGYSLSAFHLPYAAVYGLLFLMELVLKALSPLVKIHTRTASCSVRYINTDLYFRAEKARGLFNFAPPYSPEEARRRSLAYYKSVKL